MCNRLLLIKLSVLYAERLMHVTISIFSSQCVQTCYCKVNSVSLYEKIYLKFNNIILAQSELATILLHKACTRNSNHVSRSYC